MKLRFRQRLAPEIQQRFDMRRWHEREVRARLRGWVVEQFDQVLEQFDWQEIPLNRQVATRALALMDEWGLKSHDAVHLASAQLAGVEDMASLDADFRHVDGLHLWNNRLTPA